MTSSTTTQYNALGDITSVTTPTSVTAYTYDGTDANGNLEYRGLLTGTVTTVAGFTTQSTAAYDAHGALIKEVLPGAIERRTDFDLTGELVSQAYWGPEAGSAGPVPWLGWTLTVNAAGQIITEHGPDASPATGLDLVTSDVGLRYGYDQAGRLATVNDSTAGQCTTRQYLFDQRGNRTGLTQTTGPTCDAPPVTATRVYDSADRALTGADGTGAYTYDPLGRQLAIPAIDAPNPAAGDIALGYYDDDTARSITQGDTVLTYDLDVAGRRASQTTTTAGTVTGAVVNHYTDASDNPGWITTNHAGASTTTVYTDQVASDLTMAIITDAAGTRGELALATPRGDITTTISLNTPTAQADGLDNWTHYTEYGQPTTTPPTSTTGTAGNGYGWLGTKQRTTTTTGLLLMGARLYNPTTALFTSDDPIYGGNNTPYTYPNDPINDCDASGRQSCASLAQAMNETISILRRRNNESYANKYNLPLEGKNSIRGHQNQYSGYQKRLKNQAREFEKKCSYVKFGKNFKSNVRHWEAKQMTLPWNMKFYSKGRYSPKMARAASVRLPGFRGGASLGRGGGGAGRPWATK